MKPQPAGYNQNETVFLNRLVARLIAQLQPFAVKQHSFIVNDVPGDFHVNVDGPTLTMIVTAMVNRIVSKTYKSCIRISVKRINDIILIRVKDANSSNNHCPDQFWQKMNLLAAKIGGCIIENDTRKKGITTLSFSCLAAAA